MSELLRLQIGRIKVVESDFDEFESELHKDYIPKSFNIGNWETIIQRVEENQGFSFTDEQKSNALHSIINNVVYDKKADKLDVFYALY